VNNKDTYTKKVIDKSKELYDVNDENDDVRREKIINVFSANGKIRLIEVTELFDLWWIKETKTEYYLNNDSIFFIYRRETEKQWEGYENLDTRTTSVIEQRFYFKSEKCVKYLEKSVEGKLSEIEAMLKKADNVEKNCPEIESFIEEAKVLISSN
jgi:DNA-binding transcriptional regulator GbsR (MarR family)